MKSLEERTQSKAELDYVNQLVAYVKVMGARVDHLEMEKNVLNTKLDRIAA